MKKQIYYSVLWLCLLIGIDGICTQIDPEIWLPDPALRTAVREALELAPNEPRHTRCHKTINKVGSTQQRNRQHYRTTTRNKFRFFSAWRKSYIRPPTSSGLCVTETP